MIIDTHAHYDDEQFDEDREEILGKMQDAGIGMIMDAGSTILSWDKIVNMSRRVSVCVRGDRRSSRRSRKS